VGELIYERKGAAVAAAVLAQTVLFSAWVSKEREGKKKRQ
jgi:hypothetical protein